MPPLRGRRPGGAGSDVAVVLGALLVLGLLGALLWLLLVDPAQLTKTARGGAMGENDLSKRFNADAWFVVIGAGLGLLAGLVLTAWRSRDALLTGALVLAGSLLAAGVMLLVGRLVGPHGTEAALRAASVGDTVPEPLAVNTWVVLLGWPVGALMGSLLVLVATSPESERWGPAPVPSGGSE